MKRLLIFPVLLLTLTGCQSLTRQFAIAYGTNTVTRNLSTELLDVHALKAGEGEAVKKVNDEVKQGLDLAWTIRKTQKDSANAQVKKHINSVRAVLDYLEKREAK